MQKSPRIRVVLLLIFVMITCGVLFFVANIFNPYVAASSVIRVDSDKIAADDVMAQINGLRVTSLADKSAVQAVRSAYDALTDMQKFLVTNLSVLEAAEDKILQLELEQEQSAPDVSKAMAVYDAIEKLPCKQDLKIADKEIILETRLAYENLTDLEKSLITNLAVLEQAEATLKALEEAAAQILLGDINQDKSINAVDALLALQISVGKKVVTPPQMEAADVDGDGWITAKDGLLILKRAVGQLKKFPTS
jgi:hypothetical protein